MLRLAERVAAAVAVVVMVVLAFLSVAFLVAAIASTAHAQDVIAPQRPLVLVPRGGDPVVELRLGLSRLEQRVAALEAELKALRSAPRGSSADVWVEMLTPDDDSCPPCITNKKQLLAAMTPVGWKFGDEGHVRFRFVPQDGATFPRFVVYSKGEEVLRMFGTITPERLADILNREIKLAK